MARLEKVLQAIVVMHPWRGPVLILVINEGPIHISPFAVVYQFKPYKIPLHGPAKWS